MSGVERDLRARSSRWRERTRSEIAFHRRRPGLRAAALLALTLLGLLAGGAPGAWADDIFRPFYLGRYGEVAQMIEDQPGAVNWREPGSGRTLLLVATDSGLKSMVEFLVAKGANVNATDSAGDSAVTLAALKGYVPLIEFLVQKGAKLDVYGAVALNKTNELARLLQHRFPWGEPPPAKDKPAPIMLASRYDHVEAMRVLLENKASPFERNKQGREIIHEAAQRGRRDQIKLLLEHAVSVDEPGGGNETALHVAAAAADVETVKFLLDNGADIKLTDWQARSAVHFAVLGNKLANLKLLLEKGGDPSAPSADGPPLHIAIWKNSSLEMVRLLLDHGADLREKDSTGKTALDLARRYRQDAIVTLLKQRGAF